MVLSLNGMVWNWKRGGGACGPLVYQSKAENELKLATNVKNNNSFNMKKTRKKVKEIIASLTGEDGKEGMASRDKPELLHYSLHLSLCKRKK